MKNLLFSLVALFAVPALPIISYFQSATVSSGSAEVAIYTVGGGPGTTPDQVLETTVVDPNNPKEPWRVTSYRRPDESEESFVRRHLDMVKAVREALK